MQNKKIYIVLSQTGTWFSRAIKFFTKDPYNHASISLDKELNHMYSFGRKKVNNPLRGGFVREYTDKGVFAKFKDTKAMVVCLDVSEEQFRKISEKLYDMEQDPQKYKYNFRGMILGYMHLPSERHNRFYCSEFVRYILEYGNIDGVEELPRFIKPMKLLKIEHTKIYTGDLQSYKRKVQRPTRTYFRPAGRCKLVKLHNEPVKFTLSGSRKIE